MYNAAVSETSSEKQWTEIHTLLIGKFGYINIHTWLCMRLWEIKQKKWILLFIGEHQEDFFILFPQALYVFLLGQLIVVG